MKRLMILVLLLCVSVLFFVSVLSLGAQEANTEIWDVYSLLEDANEIPYYSTPPSYSYTSKGLRVTPSADMGSYTVQTEHAFTMENGIFMEIKLDPNTKPCIIIFHIWDQNGMMLSNHHCGSGWQGVLQFDQNSFQFVMSAFIWDTQVKNDGENIEIVGAIEMSRPVDADGGATYTLEIRNGTIFVNGNAMEGSDEALANMKQLRPDGSAYVGVTVNMTEKNRGIPLTVTRFGKSAETATVPGAGGTLPDTGESSPVTIAPTPSVTEPSKETEKVTNEQKPETGSDVNTGTLPVEPDQTKDPADMTTEPSKGPYGETEPSTKKDIEDENVDRFMEKLEKGCGSVLGSGIMSLLSIVAAAYVCSRKKN